MKVKSELLREFLMYKLEADNIRKETLEMYLMDINDFINYFGEEKFFKVTENEVLKYIDNLREKYQVTSMNRKISSLKGFFKFLVKRNIVEKSPVDIIALEKTVAKNPEKMEEWEIENIMLQCDSSPKGKRDKLLMKVLKETAFSLNEALAIKVENLKGSNYKNILNTFNLERVTISEELGEEIKEFVEKTRDKLYKEEEVLKDLLFYGLTRQGFRVRFMALAEKAGLSRDVTPAMMINAIKEERKLNEELDDDITPLAIRAKYFEIGIGDD